MNHRFNLEKIHQPKQEFVASEHKFGKNKTVKYRYKEALYR